MDALRIMDTPWKTDCNTRGARLDISKLTYNPEHVVRIYNLPARVSQRDVEGPCARYGRVVMTHLWKQSSAMNIVLATVVMESASEATAVMRGLQGAYFGKHEISIVILSTELKSQAPCFFIQPKIEKVQERNPSMTGRTLTAFPCFTMLMPELRIMIWKASQLQGRTVQLEWYLDHGVYVYKSRNRVPACLHVCRESRIEALKVYELAFPSPHPDDPTSAILPRTYFDFSKDELYLSMPDPALRGQSMWNFMHPNPNADARYPSSKDLAQIKHLALDLEIWSPGATPRLGTWFTLGDMTRATLGIINQCVPSLQRIKIVFNKHLCLDAHGRANVEQIKFEQIFRILEDTYDERAFTWRLCELLKNAPPPNSFPQVEWSFALIARPKRRPDARSSASTDSFNSRHLRAN